MRAPVLTLLALLLAGCLQTPQPGNGTPIETAGPQVTAEWWNGTVSGPTASVALNPAFVFFDVGTNHTALDLSLEASGGGVRGFLFAPSCDAIECAERFLAYDEPAQWNTTQPEAGEWEMHIAKDDPGVTPVAYRLRVQWTADAA